MASIAFSNTNIKVPDLQISTALSSGAIIGIISLVLGIHILSAFGIGLTVYLIIRLLLQMNRTIPMLEIMLVMAAMQWIIGPIIDYQTEATHFKYYMYVEESIYMGIVIPAFFVFQFTVLFKTKQFNLKINEIATFVSKFKTIPYYLIAISIALSIGGKYLPGALGFVVFLLVNLKYIGIIMLLFSDSKNKWQILAIAMSVSFASSIAAGMFHDFILWGIIIFCVVSITQQIKLPTKLGLFFIGVIFLVILQSVKGAYREATWFNKGAEYQGSKLELFYNLSKQQKATDNLMDETKLNDLNTRLNQGWIISRVIQQYETKPFEGGSSVKDAIIAAIFPRFLMPDKKGGGGKETYQTMTGFQLVGTAMGVSLMGEFYGNFGKTGTIIAFAIWGFFLNFVYRYFAKEQEKFPLAMLFLPILFLQVVKAESDLITVLNHLIKAWIIIAIILAYVKHHLKQV